MFKKKLFFFLIFLIFFYLGACEDLKDNNNEIEINNNQNINPNNNGKDLEISGTWEDFGNKTIFDNENFNTAYGQSSIVEYDNSGNTFFYQMSADDQYNPGKYGKLVWTEIENDSFYYCLIAYGKETLEEAKDDTATADSSNPDTGGCGGFAWSKVTKFVEKK